MSHNRSELMIYHNPIHPDQKVEPPTKSVDRICADRTLSRVQTVRTNVVSNILRGLRSEVFLLVVVEIQKDLSGISGMFVVHLRYLPISVKLQGKCFVNARARNIVACQVL